MQAAAELAAEARRQTLITNRGRAAGLKEESRKLEELRESVLREDAIQRRVRHAKVMQERSKTRVALETLRCRRQQCAQRRATERSRMSRDLAERQDSEKTAKQGLIK
eukprot:scaffold1628_cov407-Prasinococcus_capsulatus_cf.AAC.25